MFKALKMPINIGFSSVTIAAWALPGAAAAGIASLPGKSSLNVTREA
jgi:hypothetical protein